MTNKLVAIFTPSQVIQNVTVDKLVGSATMERVTDLREWSGVSAGMFTAPPIPVIEVSKVAEIMAAVDLVGDQKAILVATKKTVLQRLHDVCSKVYEPVPGDIPVMLGLSKNMSKKIIEMFGKDDPEVLLKVSQGIKDAMDGGEKVSLKKIKNSLLEKADERPPWAVFDYLSTPELLYPNIMQWLDSGGSLFLLALMLDRQIDQRIRAIAAPGSFSSGGYPSYLKERVRRPGKEPGWRKESLSDLLRLRAKLTQFARPDSPETYLGTILAVVYELANLP